MDWFGGGICVWIWRVLPANREGFRHRLGEGVSFGKSMVPGTCCQTLYGTNRSMIRSIMIHTQKKSPLTPRNRPNINYEALVRSPSTCNPSLGTDQRGKIYIIYIYIRDNAARFFRLLWWASHYRKSIYTGIPVLNYCCRNIPQVYIYCKCDHWKKW